MRTTVLAAAMIALAGLLPSGAQAECVCRCVNGQMQPICRSALDIAPFCPGMCPLAGPSIAPIQPPMLPPLGTQSCQQAQVYNSYAGRYEWRTVCR